MEIKHKLWLEQDGKVIFGEGREALFKAIQKHHSLNAALKEGGIDMSYRAAWGRLKASQERLGAKLIESDSKRGGAVLTQDAKDLLEFFEKLDGKVEAVIKAAALELAAILNKQKQG